MIDYKGTYEKIAFVAFSVLWIFVSSLCPTSFKTELGCAKGPNEISCVNVGDPWVQMVIGGQDFEEIRYHLDLGPPWDPLVA